MPPMLVLHHAPRSRSSRIIWLLEELGAPYEIALTDIPRMDGPGAPDPKNPHPDKKVPALVDDGALVTESAAIVLYLTDKFPAAGLGPVVGDPLRGAYLAWLALLRSIRSGKLPPPRLLRRHPSSGRRGRSFFSPPFQGGVARSDGVVRAARYNLAQAEPRT